MGQLTKEQQIEAQAKAQDLFLNKELAQNEIARIVGVTEKTIGKWKKEYGWQELRKARKTTRVNVLLKLDELLLELLENGGTADQIAKIAASIEKLSDNTTLMSHRYQTCSEFTAYFKANYPQDKEKLMMISSYMDEYLKAKANGR